MPAPTPPLPSEPGRKSNPLKHRFLKIMRWAALFSIMIAMLAVALIAQGETEIRAHMLIATALGVGLSALLGIALMTLVFLSNRTGHDIKAAAHQQKEYQQKDKNDPRT